jgi:Xaa-Pro aminopeptidase
LPVDAAQLPHPDEKSQAIQHRRARVEAAAEAILITDPDNLLWLTGDWDAKPHAWLLYAGDVWHTVSKSERRGDSPARHSSVRADEILLQTTVADICQSSKVAFPLLVDRGQRWADVRTVRSSHRLVDGRLLISELRQYKDAVEVEIMVRNARAVRDALDAASRELRAGVTELEIWAVIASTLQSHDPASLEIYGNCASGPRTVEPDPHATSRVIAEHDPLLLDVYPRLYGYFADLTRTWCCGGATREMGRMIDAVNETLILTAAMVSPGVRGVELDREAKAMLGSRGYPNAYPHHTGHGLGVKQQERPWIRRRSSDVIREGMIIALEPACYVEGIGGVRLENEYLVTPDGAALLTDLTTAQIASLDPSVPRVLGQNGARPR